MVNLFKSISLMRESTTSVKNVVSAIDQNAFEYIKRGYKMKQDLIIYGAGGAGRELATFLKGSEEWQVKGFVEDETDEEQIEGIKVLGKRGYLEKNGGAVVVSILSNPYEREKIINELKQFPSIKFPRVLTPGTYYSNNIEWGEGVVVGLPCSLLSTGLKLGNFVFINYNTGIGHDTQIGDYSILYSHIDIGGGTRIGHHCIIGSGVTIRPGVEIGNGCIVGGGSMVVKNVPDNVTVAGVPAKVIKEH